MNWKNLLNPNRLGDSKDYSGFSSLERSDYLRDYDRILFSSAFRRMHDKTQVFPVPESDFIHSRLTHSLEVSAVARSLGNLAGKFIIDTENLDKSKYRFHIFGNINAAAAIAHDIGNPPFGHSGEFAIQEYFKKNKDRFSFLSKNEFRDFEEYEGNAHGFRLLTNHHPDETNKGLMLTYATLAAFTKYPIYSNSKNRETKGRISTKKFGYFQTEKSNFEQVAINTGLIKKSEGQWARHPLAFLVEAADNICYRIIDLEDGFKLKYLKIREIEELIFPLLMNDSDFAKTKATYDIIKDEGEKVGYLRAKSINQLVTEVIEVFKANYSSIMKAEFDKDLTKEIRSAGILEGEIKKANIELYNKKPVLEIELAGYKVIKGLLDFYLDAVFDKENKMSQKLLQIIPTQFKSTEKDSEYESIMKIVDYIARMTDSYALNLYKKLSGIELPKIH
jgi:dGTPase